jgi:HlyD family secretion protein
MKIGKVILAVVVLAGLTVPLVSCGTQPAEAEVQVATVARGNLTIDITAAGNLAFAKAEDLAFEVASTVDEVLVQAGDVVEKGKVLAKLDTSAWEDHLSSLEDQWIAKQRALTAAERDLETKKRAIATKERDVLSAQNTVTNTEKALAGIKETYSWTDVEAAQAELDRARTYLQYALDNLSEASGAMSAIWERAIINAQAQLTAAETKLNSVLTVLTSEEWLIKENEVTIARGRLTDAQTAVNDAHVAVADAQIAIDDAKRAVTKARNAYDDALATSLNITAPFDGFISKVNAKGGDEVNKGTIAVQIVDPTRFEVEIMVNQMDIFQVKQDGEARVAADALPGVQLPAKITHISPTATVQSGVVNYSVKVEISSAAPSPAVGTSAPSVSAPTGTGASSSSSQSGALRKQAQATLPDKIELREGLSVTVSIVVAERNDIILVPSRAITREGMTSYVQVQKDAKTTEKRAIKTGISNGSYTEVLEGLNEGETIILPKVTAPESSQTNRSGLPGMGIPIPR